MKNKIGFIKPLISLVLCLTLILSCVSVTAFAAGESLSDDIVILYTNDIHTYIDGVLSYDVIAAIKDDLQQEYRYVILADAGDHIQGTAYGSMDKGESIIKLMNAADYDVATLGNHEFDYNMQGCMNAIDWAEFPYISCNFYRESDGVRGENVLDGYAVFDCGDQKIAFVGITTPETFSKTTPAYFQDGNGNFIYGISGGEDGADLKQDVQKAIDNAEQAGATQVIALGHLGVDPSSSPWTSEETIAGVSGLDAFIDGHSHTVMEGKAVKDKDGNDVLLTQTGEYFNRIGMMVIDSETGDITTDFIEYEGNETDGYTLTSELYNKTALISDTAVKTVKEDWIGEIDNKLGQKIGSTEVIFDNYDSDGNRLVRSQSTNSGDLAADALYYLFDNMNLDVDVAVMNGGGIRNATVTGDITYKTCKNIHPFGNVACLQTVTGQQLLDLLEWGARNAGVSENGGFTHVSGITYKINTSVEDTTKSDGMGAWTGGPDKYRVCDVKVYNKDTDKWDELDLDAKYNLAGYNYTLRDLGDGFAMLDGAVNVLDYVMEDYMVLANYIQGFENGVVKADNSPLLAKYPGLLIDYSDINGSGRITLTSDVKPSIIHIAGVRATADNADDVLGEKDGDAATVTYDVKTNTITLKNADIKGASINDFGFTANIISSGDLNIVLEGENSITALDAAGTSLGIIASGDLSVSGDGTLKVTGGNITAVDDEYTTEFLSSGIVVLGRFTVREAEVTAVGGKVTVTGGAPDESGTETNTGASYAFYGWGGVLLDDGAVLTAVGGDTNVNTTNQDYAVNAGLYALYGDVDVYNATLIAEGNKSVGGEAASSYGIVTMSSSVNIHKDGSKVKAVSGMAEATKETGSNGVCVYMGDFVIKAGEVTVTSSKRTDVEGDAHAVYVKGETYEGDTVVGGNMYVECDSMVPDSDRNIVGTKVTLSAPYGDAVYADRGFRIADTLTISEPEDGKIGKVGTDDIRYTVVNEGGTAAQNVTIKPLTYNVTVSGLTSQMKAEVPAGKSVNEIYCEEYDVSDFSEILDTKKDGYTFGGWFTDEACTAGKEFDFDNPVTADITVYAKWIPVNQNTATGSGSAATDNKPSDVPKAGDDSRPILWFALMFISGAGILTSRISGKKRKHSEKN